MKKILWIFSINVNDGGAPFGYGANTSHKVSKEFKEALIESLPKDFSVQFISYDTQNSELPNADLIIYNDMDAKYISDSVKKTALCIPYKYIYSKNTSEIINKIQTYFI